MNKAVVRLSALSLMLSLVLGGNAFAAKKKPLKLPPLKQIKSISESAYIYGYPLVLMDVSKQVMTATPHPEGMKAPINQFAHAREFPNASFKDVVNPNVDTLYSSAWLDLTQGPVVLTLPNMGDRFYVLSMLDAYTNVFSDPGTRTNGNNAVNYAIVGPGWKGEVPSGLTKIQAPTNLVWLIGRIACAGDADYVNVHTLQSRMTLTPLSAWGDAKYMAPQGIIDTTVDTQSRPPDQVERMSTSQFFGRMCALMDPNPPAKADKNQLKKFAKLGFAPGKMCDLASYEPNQREAVLEGIESAKNKIMTKGKNLGGRNVNGWQITLKTGDYKTDYLLRAGIAKVALGANKPKDAVYPMADVDVDETPLSGDQSYVLHFSPGQYPPQNAFWSVTVVNNHQQLVENPINRYRLGSQGPLQYNSDGSLDIFLQKNSPGRPRNSNWLPIPEGQFSVVMRIYWPGPAVLNGSWNPPGIRPLTSKTQLGGVSGK